LFNVDFIVDGQVYETVKTDKTSIKMPTDPKKDGYDFDGWFWDKDTWGKPFTLNSIMNAPLSETLRVYAKFTATENHPVFYAIRTNIYSADYNSPQVTVIESWEQHSEYFITNGINLKIDIIDNYFESKLLVAIYVVEGSGSIRHDVQSVVFNEAGNTIKIDRLVPEIGTDDEAVWHIFVEINRGDCVSTDFKVSFMSERIWTVLFYDSITGGQSLDEVTVKDGDTVADYTNNIHIKFGYEILGWVVISTAMPPQTFYDFSTPVTKSFALYPVIVPTIVQQGTYATDDSLGTLYLTLHGDNKFGFAHSEISWFMEQSGYYIVKNGQLILYYGYPWSDGEEYARFDIEQGKLILVAGYGIAVSGMPNGTIFRLDDILMECSLCGSLDCNGHEITVKQGTYITDDGVSYITLHGDNEFAFVRHIATSFVPCGKYSIKNGHLMLGADEDAEQYFVFEIKDDKLILITPVMSSMPSGTVYRFIEPDESMHPTTKRLIQKSYIDNYTDGDVNPNDVGVDYYGGYNSSMGYSMVVFIRYGGSDAVLVHETVAGYTFVYPGESYNVSDKLSVLNKGKFYSLTEAYAQGLLTEQEIANIWAKYN